MRTLLSVTCLLLACQAVMAGDPKAPVAASATVSGTNAPAVTGTDAGLAVYTLKHRSSFIGTGNDHNPFWPIGWTKMENISDDGPSIDPHVEDFTVTTIMLNDPPMAVINGKDMAEGEVAALPVNGQSVVVQLMAVQDGRVILRWQNKNLVIPLHRDEELSPAATGQPAAGASDTPDATALR
jgi:hypothetical protein